VASEVVGQYPAWDGSTRPTVVDHVQPDGQGLRVDPDVTLDDAGVHDGDQLRVAFQATAGAVNPQDREDALYRARNQIVAYAKSRDGVTVQANSNLMPTEYEVEFRQRSLAISADGGPEPVETDGPHLILIQLGPDFPIKPPRVFWLSQIFHPNVYPTYEGEQARANPDARGLVCLGMISESYQAKMDFGDLCQQLVDMAGYRNYGLFELDADGTPLASANYYDERAFAWALDNQDRIAAIGGQRWDRFQEPRKRSYPNVIQVVD
jgi:hypothetical protein